MPADGRESGATRSSTPALQAASMIGQLGPSSHNLAWFYAAFSNFSTLSFADPVLERKFRDVQQSHFAGQAFFQCFLTLGILGMTTVRLAKAQLPLAEMMTILLPTTIVTASMIAVVLAIMHYYPATYAKFWQEISIIMRLYITYQAVICRDALPPFPPLSTLTVKSFARDFLEPALCPLMLIVPAGLQLRLLPNAVTILGMLAIILRRTAWFCAGPLAEPSLAARFHLGAPLAKRVATALIAPVAWPTSPLMVHPGGLPMGCTSQLALWQVMAAAVSLTICILREILQRRAFLAANWETLGMGQGGKQAAAHWPFGHPRGINASVGLLICLVPAVGVLWSFVSWSLPR